MKKGFEKLIDAWKREEQNARIHGWDFSCIDGRYEEDTDFGWNYREKVLSYLTPDKRLLDTDTGGGEFLLSLSHPYENTTVTENYPPNFELCKKTLSPLGINIAMADAGKELPFDDGTFDVVINRHGDFCAKEIYRVLKAGGVFVTQQVGADNDRELVTLLQSPAPQSQFPGQYLSITKEKFTEAGFEIIEGGEGYGSIRFFDVGALVWFARIIEWEFCGFSVDSCLEGLIKAQAIIEKQGFVEGKTHRFFLAARKGS
jgi:SAM-dependent methyltransferase